MDETPYRAPQAELGEGPARLSMRPRIALAGAAVIALAGFADTWTYGTAATLLLDLVVPLAIGVLAVLWIGADETIRERPAALFVKVLAFVLPPIGLLVHFGRSRRLKESLKVSALFLAYLGAILVMTILAIILGEYLRFGEVRL